MKDDPEVQLKDLGDMVLLEVVNEGVQQHLIRGSLALCVLRVSIFNQQNSISNNESLYR